MFEKIKALFDSFPTQDEIQISLDEQELRLASAALLVRASIIDGETDKSESDAIERLLTDKFNLTTADASKLITEATHKEHEAVDLYGFTSVLTRQLDQDGRQNMIKMLWEIVLADGVIHEFESNMVWRVSELMGVSTRDRVRLRKEVEAGR